ncbi:MAG: hypothetical protein TREMPRED_005212 [Tremellales sp. Tagirdzhanova-0007]|nr:MAG: hypothetical protein TREMPRED_005212 [Tremellales sp. Tagirdzhanova-0007]
MPDSDFPLRRTLVLCLCKISEASVVCFIMPFVNEMVIGFGIIASSAARYAGLIESALVFTEAIFSPLWGVLADSHGRKPLLILGLSAFSLACIAIGLSRSLLTAIIARSISGVLGAVAVLVRTVQFEITGPEHIDRVLEYLTPCWAIGAAIGPMVEGALANPSETMPSLFGGEVWRQFPFLLPSLATALLPAFAAMACLIWLPEPVLETLAHPHASPPSREADESQPLLQGASPPDGILIKEYTIWELASHPKISYTLALSALLAFVSMAYNASFMMMASTEIIKGGLGLAPWHIGIMLGLSSILGVLIATYAIPIFVRPLGWYGTLRITACAHVVLFPSIALAGVIARYEGEIGWMTSLVLFFVLVAYEIGETSYTGVDVAFADRAPPGCLARINGLSLSAASIGRMLAPALSGQLWSLSLEIQNELGPYLIWSVFTLIAIVWWGASLHLDLPNEAAKWDDENDENVESYGSIGHGVLPSLLKGSASETTLCEDATKWIP